MTASGAPRHAADARHLQAFVTDDTSFRLARVGTRRSRRATAGFAFFMIGVGVVTAAIGLGLIVAPHSDQTAVGVVWLICGSFVAWISLHLHHRPPGVYLTDTQVRSRDEFGFTWRMPRADVVSVDIGTAVLPRRTVANLVPFIRKVDGSRMWLTPLAGDPVGQPAAAAQLDVVHALRNALNVGGQDAPGSGDGRADAGTDPRVQSQGRRRDAWRHGPRASAVIVGSGYLLFEVGLWIWVVTTLVGQGIHVDDLRHAKGAQVVTLTVDHVVKDCYKSCTYKSVGSYTAPWSGQVITGAHVVPNYQDPHHGPLQVVASPGHQREALQAGYNGKGYIAFGIAMGLLLSVAPLLVVGVLLIRLHRRLRVRRAVAGLPVGATPTGRFRGILRGPGINPLVGVSRLELTPTQLIEVEKLIGGDHRWTVSLDDVRDVQFDVNVAIDAAPSGTWQTTRFTTKDGTYTLTCDPAYVPLVQRALDRHALRT